MNGPAIGLGCDVACLAVLLLVVTMYAGRAGLLALAIYLARRVTTPRYRYPEETVMAA